jgi:hypothetical protein
MNRTGSSKALPSLGTGRPRIIPQGEVGKTYTVAFSNLPSRQDALARFVAHLPLITPSEPKTCSALINGFRRYTCNPPAQTWVRKLLIISLYNKLN